MIIDNLLQYSAAQALTATAASTNSVDHSSDRDIGIGEPMCVVITVDVTAGGTAPTLSIAVQSDSVSGFGSAVTVAQTGTLVAAQLVAGARFALPIPPDSTFNRYSRLNYTVAGTSPTVSVTANLIPMRFVQADQYGPAAFTVQ